MATTSVLASTKEATTAPGYALRGLGLFELHSEAIRQAYRGGGHWLVPSGTTPDKLYEVRVGTRPERDRCECTGFYHHGHCSHVVCARRAHRLSAVCDACGERTWWTQLTQVEEDDALLAFYPGDVVCEKCVAEGAWS